MDDEEIQGAALASLNQEHEVRPGDAFVAGKGVLVSIGSVQELWVRATMVTGDEPEPAVGEHRFGLWVSLVKGPMSARYFYVEMVYDDHEDQWELHWESPEAAA